MIPCIIAAWLGLNEVFVTAWFIAFWNKGTSGIFKERE
jgi:hypothetical protein